jgi:hypothetical protein
MALPALSSSARSSAVRWRTCCSSVALSIRDASVRRELLAQVVHRGGAARDSAGRILDNRHREHDRDLGAAGVQHGRFEGRHVMAGPELRLQLSGQGPVGTARVQLTAE